MLKGKYNMDDNKAQLIIRVQKDGSTIRAYCSNCGHTTHQLYTSKCAGCGVRFEAPLLEVVSDDGTLPAILDRPEGL